ncbi:MAG: ASCH domain-containing protein [Thermoplasmataceae archaeon]
MTERPIIFSGEMVRAIFEGQKTQTRRPVKPQPNVVHALYGNGKILTNLIFRNGKDGDLLPCPYGQIGSRLWVKETFCLEGQVERDQEPPFSDGRPIQYWDDGVPCSREASEHWVQPHYKATDPTPELAYTDTDGEPTVRWKPSIHMPRWASRITLEITDIRVQRVQEITHGDALAEGVKAFSENFPLQEKVMPLSCHAFANLWNSIYGKKGFGWDANPWVWTITFRRIEKDGRSALAH